MNTNTDIHAASAGRVVVLSVLVLLVLFYILYETERDRTFPSLRSGDYAGSVEGVTDKPLPIVGSYESGSKTLTILFVEDGAQSESLQLVSQQTIFGEPAIESYPVPVHFRGTNFQLIGEQDDESNYSGALLDRSMRKVGTWHVMLQPPREALVQEGEQWLSLIMEHKIAKSEKLELEGNLQQVEVDLKRYEEAVHDAKSISLHAKQKEEEESRELKIITEKTARLRADVESLRKKVAFAQRLSPYGKLVTLSRDSFKAEKQFFSNAFLVETGDGAK